MSSTLRKKQNIQRTVKAFDNDILLINKEARRLGCTAAEIIHNMCSDLRKHIYLKELGDSFDGLHTDAKHFAEFEAEHKLWDSTLSDGLDNAT